MPDSNIRLFASDLDHTLIGHASGAAAFAATWQSLPKKERPVLVYSTGRLLDDARQAVAGAGLPQPDYLICGVGTTIFNVKSRRVLKAFADIFEEGWDAHKVPEIIRRVLPEAEMQARRYQNAFKSSWHVADLTGEDIARLENALEAEGLEVTVVYSSNRDLDVLPKLANKGNALGWLLKHLNIPADEALAAGDTGNDSAMFFLKGIRGIVVGNAQPELIEATVGYPVYVARKVCGEGVLEGLQHFGVIDEIVEDDTFEPEYEAEFLHLFYEEDGRHELSREQKDYLITAYEKAVEGLQRNLTPIGFSACSIADNEMRGTDINYHSVWGRDGSITLIGSLPLEGDEVRQCQRNTLTTLLSNISPPGQIPANVGVISGEPDYSGVGGISAIDSGLWVVIATYEYIRKTQDLEFLRGWMPVLQRAMNWLTAHDSNNDALLEIPEAGDWTDLFGRSYNVLYDEVLWYRANIAFGRLLEFCGDWRRAGDYLRWARQIKAAILRKFWPSTKTLGDDNLTFADLQSRLGDTNYLLAQITPFGFDWRLDSYANILAFLMNVLDIDRAKIAFRFMWGVGINEPYPVANLYPTVQSGDPEWRSYYTVNLLNLPGHYHNGGIWPFIGAQWVRFINQLGFRDIALQELVRLGEINQRGIAHEWEFNEWAHGKTGRPMGKAFQAWSCSEYIFACHELRATPANLK